MIFDSGLDDESIIVSYVATDNLHGGELAAEEMARRLNGKGDVILLRYAAGSESTEQREQGFLSKLAELPEIRVVSSNEYCGTTPELALDKAQQVFNKFARQVRRRVRHVRAQLHRRARRAGGCGPGRRGGVYRLRSQPPLGEDHGARARCRASSCRTR